MVARLFFCLKISRLKATVTSIDVKTGSPDLADFATNWLLLYFLNCGISRLRHANGCTNCQYSPSCFLRELPQVCGLFSAALAVRAMVVRPLAYPSHHIAIYQEINLNSNPSLRKFRQIWRTGFYIDGCVTVRTTALRQVICKRKKEFATI
jgi:hypothetical protein